MAAREEETGIHDRQRDRAAVLPVAIIVVISSITGIVLGLLIDWFPTPASTQADPIDTLWDVLIIASVPVFVGVQAFVLYCVWRFRMRPGQELQDGAPIHGNTRLEVVWTVIPAVIILGLCTYAYFVLEDIEEAKANEWRINVTGQQFTWTFEYPEAITGGEPIKSAQLYIPEDQPVEFHVRSRDVLHDFWVPAWRMKIDAVPGITTKYRVTPNRLGRYSIVCAELCGIGHAYMRQTANVLTQDDFDAWLEKKKSAGGGRRRRRRGRRRRGRRQGALHRRQRRGHGLRRVPHAVRRRRRPARPGRTSTRCSADMDADAIREAIVNPDAELAKGFAAGIMPGNYEDLLSPEELDALVKYLDEVSK